MKLSEAIRLGSMLKPQGFGELFTHLGDGRLASCAIGAAEDAIYGEQNEASDYDADEGAVYVKFMGILRTFAGCPACSFGPHWVQQVVHHLNDHHRWTREQIADWVEGIENAQEQPSQPVPVAVVVTA